MKQEDIETPIIRAGDFGAISLLERWRITGVLVHETSAASPLIDDMCRLDEWLETDRAFPPLALGMLWVSPWLFGAPYR